MSTMAVIVSVVLLCLLLIMLNNTPLGYREQEEPVPEAEHNLFDPRARSLQFISKGNTKAVICIHGFPSTPYTFTWCAQALHAQGFDVYAPLLPGFGTSPDDLVKTHFSHWLGALRSCYLDVRSSYGKVYLLGASLGGSLALSLAAETQAGISAPDGICTIGTPVFMNRLHRGILKHPGLYFSRTAGWFTRAIKPGISHGGDELTSVDGAHRWIGYRGLYPRQIYSILMNLRKLRRKLPRVDVPLLVIHAQGDRTVPSLNAWYLAQRIGSRDKRLWMIDMGDLPHNQHCLIIHDSVMQQVFRACLHFFQST